MADPIFNVPNDPEYNTEIRKLQTTDPAHADNTFNPLFETLIGNTHAVKLAADKAQTGVDKAREDIEKLGEAVEDTKDAGSVLLSDGTSVEDAVDNLEMRVGQKADSTDLDALKSELESQISEATATTQATKYTVPASGWTAAAADEDNVIWMAQTVANADITASSVVMVIPADPAAEKIIAQYVRGYIETYTGGFRLFASAAPEDALNIYYTVSKGVG